MKLRMTNVPFQTPRFSPLVPNSTRESLSIMEKNHAIDLTGFVIMCLDVWYGKTSNFSWFTRCGVDVTSFRVMDWSKNLGVICNDDTLAETTLTTTIRKWDAKTRKDIAVEFIDVTISDINDMINWLRIEKDIFYTPPKDRKADEEKIEAKIEPLSSTFYCCDSKLVTETQRLQEENKKLKKKAAEQQKKIDSYEATLSKITDIMKLKYAGPAWSETWEDLVERIKRMKEKVETLEAAKTDWRDSFEKAQDSRSAFCKKLKEALNVDYRYPGSFPKMEEDILAEVARLKGTAEDLRKQLEARDAKIEEMKSISKGVSKQRDDLVKFRSEVAELSGLGLLCGPFDENTKKIIDTLKKKLTTVDFYVEDRWEAEYRAFVQQIFEAVGTPCIDEVIHTNYLAAQALEAVKALKAGHDDARGLSLKIEELEEKLKHAASVEVWYRRTNRELVMERDHYKDICEEQERDLQEWEEWFDKVCEELDTPERDPEEVFSELRGKLIELDNLAEFKAKLAEVIKLPEDMKRTATTEDYISSFEHTKKEWRKMEIKLENYEREIRLLNAWLEDRKKKLDDILPDYTNAKCARAELENLYAYVKGNEPPLESTPSAIAAVCKYEFDTMQTMKTDYTNAKCARAELANLYRRTFDVDRLDPSLSPHEIAVQIRKRMRELEQKLNSIKDIYDGD